MAWQPVLQHLTRRWLRSLSARQQLEALQAQPGIGYACAFPLPVVAEWPLDLYSSGDRAARIRAVLRYVLQPLRQAAQRRTGKLLRSLYSEERETILVVGSTDPKCMYPHFEFPPATLSLPDACHLLARRSGLETVRI